MRTFVPAILAGLLFCGLTSAVDPPTFPNQYTAVGVILLPYAQLREPFTAYYDGELDRSRIDYYGDLMVTLQKSSKATGNAYPNGAQYKIGYDVDKNDKPRQNCFESAGSQDDAVTAQSIFPDLTNFVYAGKEACPRVSVHQVSWKKHTQSRKNTNQFASVRPAHGAHCDKWQYVEADEEKNSTYTFWARFDQKTDEYIPVHYEMLGFDSLLGSHFDQYEIAYFKYRAGNVSDDIFNVDSEYSCGDFPGPGAETRKLNMNPIGHYLHNTNDEIKAHFDDYKSDFNRTYPTKAHESERHQLFRHNLRYIATKNRQLKTYKLALNQLADRSEDELKILRGVKKSKSSSNGGLPFQSSLSVKDLPDSIDWNLRGAVTEVRDQAICGSCYTFGTIGTIVGSYFLKYNKLLQFSEQQVLDCSWNEGNNGCDGGEDFRIYNYIMKIGGLSLDQDYGAYIGQDGKCHEQTVQPAVSLTGFVNVTQYDPTELKKAVVGNGPITIAINAAVRTFSFYSRGVYYDSECLGDEDHLDHQVLLTGYGTLDNEPYWQVKNSWSTHWGNNGYILISQKDNMCGVTTSPTYPLIK